MPSNRPLTTDERLEIVAALKRGNLSHRELAKRFNRAQSTISQIARDAGVAPTHRRKRSPRAHDVEGTYSREERIALVDRALGVIGGLVEGGGLNARELRETTQALKAALEARRAEDILEPEEADETHSGSTLELEAEFRRLDEEMNAEE